jgi:predicted RNA-binding protein with TRAM domain
MYEKNDNAPVNPGDEVTVVIEGVGGRGDGIAKVDGFVLFIPNAKKDQRVKIRITKVLKNLGFGEIVGKGDDLPVKTRAKVVEPPKPVEYPEDSEDFGEELED